MDDKNDKNNLEENESNEDDDKEFKRGTDSAKEVSSDSKEGEKPVGIIARLSKSYHDWKTYKDKEYDQLIEKESLWWMIIKFFLPFWLSIIFIFFLVIIVPGDVRELGSLFFIYFFTPLGMEIGVTTGITVLGLNAYLVVGFMLMIDALSAMFLIWNLSYTRLLPLIGRLVRYSENKGSKALKKYTWVENLAFFGLVLFVMIPLYGTGSILGAIVGRLMGMDPWKNWFAILVGSSIRLSLLALANTFIESAFF